MNFSVICKSKDGSTMEGTGQCSVLGMRAALDPYCCKDIENTLVKKDNSSLLYAFEGFFIYS